jgi:hypothetical protein
MQVFKLSNFWMGGAWNNKLAPGFPKNMEIDGCKPARIILL